MPQGKAQQFQWGQVGLQPLAQVHVVLCRQKTGLGKGFGFRVCCHDRTHRSQTAHPRFLPVPPSLRPPPNPRAVETYFRVGLLPGFHSLFSYLPVANGQHVLLKLPPWHSLLEPDAKKIADTACERGKKSNNCADKPRPSENINLKRWSDNHQNHNKTPQPGGDFQAGAKVVCPEHRSHPIISVSTKWLMHEFSQPLRRPNTH